MRFKSFYLLSEAGMTDFNKIVNAHKICNQILALILSIRESRSLTYSYLEDKNSIALYTYFPNFNVKYLFIKKNKSKTLASYVPGSNSILLYDSTLFNYIVKKIKTHESKHDSINSKIIKHFNRHIRYSLFHELIHGLQKNFVDFAKEFKADTDKEYYNLHTEIDAFLLSAIYYLFYTKNVKSFDEMLKFIQGHMAGVHYLFDRVYLRSLFYLLYKDVWIELTEDNKRRIIKRAYAFYDLIKSNMIDNSILNYHK